ncbi:MAG: phosphopantothenoylcysteine decarboxylase [Planctomycetota bacterium]
MHVQPPTNLNNDADRVPNTRPRLLISAGPTHEPLDAVRYIGNRSSGRMGIAIAEAAAQRGWNVEMLLGPTPRRPDNAAINVHRYTSCADLEAGLDTHFPRCDVLIMAAAVSDYRPGQGSTDVFKKRRRQSDTLTITLEKTPDLVAHCAQTKQPAQLIVAFALEPRANMLAAAAAKLARKGTDLIVANPLETMDADTVDATLLASERSRLEPTRVADPGMTKPAFAQWLLQHIEHDLRSHAGGDAQKLEHARGE